MYDQKIDSRCHSVRYRGIANEDLWFVERELSEAEIEMLTDDFTDLTIQKRSQSSGCGETGVSDEGVLRMR